MASVDNEVSSDTVKHEFSSPWDDSDLVLVVEDQKLHVHQFILKMASPVFKVMLSADFKEKDAAEITLPEKKANEFVDLLRQIYPQFNRESITLTNVEYIYKLAEEYQMKTVTDACRKYFKSVKKTKKNAIEILMKAQVCQTADKERQTTDEERKTTNEIRQSCYKALEELSLNALEMNKLFKELDASTKLGILLLKAKRLEKCITNALPQLWWLIERLYFYFSALDPSKVDEKPLTECNSHNSYRSRSFDFITCMSCQAMLIKLGTQARDNTRSYHNMCLDKNTEKILEEMENLQTGRGFGY